MLNTLSPNLSSTNPVAFSSTVTVNVTLFPFTSTFAVIGVSFNICPKISISLDVVLVLNTESPMYVATTV